MDALHAVVQVVDGLGAAVAAVGCRQVFDQGAEAVEVVVGVVGNADRRGGARTVGVGGDSCRAPGLQQFAARRVAVAGNQPLAAYLRGGADQATIGVVGRSSWR